jgi:hypothetical protein
VGTLQRYQSVIGHGEYPRWSGAAAASNVTATPFYGSLRQMPRHRMQQVHAAGTHACRGSRGAVDRQVPIHDVKQRSVVRSRGALLRRVCVSSRLPSLSLPLASPRGLAPAASRQQHLPSLPNEGGWSADRRTLSFGRACDARPPCPGATGTSLGAPPWRFSDADPRSRLPAVEPEPQRLPAPSRKAWRSGSGPPCVAVRAAAGTPLPAPPAGPSPEDAPP